MSQFLKKNRQGVYIIIYLKWREITRLNFTDILIYSVVISNVFTLYFNLKHTLALEFLRRV